MKSLPILFFIIVITRATIAQKKELDTSSFSSWSFVDNGVISPNGKYVAYVIVKSHLPDSPHELVVADVTSKWQQVYPGANFLTFSQDDKFAIFMLSNDSVGVVDLSKKRMRKFPGIEKVNVVKNTVFFTYKSSPTQLHVYNLKLSRDKVLEHVDKYFLNEKDLIICSSVKDSLERLCHYNTIAGVLNEIYTGSPVNNISFNDNGGIVFTTVHHSISEVWYYDFDKQRIRMLFDDLMPIFDGFKFSNVRSFSPDGNLLFFYVNKEREEKVNKNIASVSEIWGYRDADLPPFRRMQPQRQLECLYSYSFDKNKVIKVANNNQKLLDFKSDHVLLAEKRDLGSLVNGVMTSYAYSLLNISNDKLTKIPFQSYPTLSTMGKYVLSFDTSGNSYFTYDTQSGKMTTISESLPNEWSDYYNDFISGNMCDDCSGKWQCSDSVLIIRGRYDLWQFDPEWNNKPVNLTNGFGRRNHISFYTDMWPEGDFFHKGRKLLLLAFNHVTKENGFYELTVGVHADPKKLYMGNYIYCLPKSSVYQGGPPPKKADKTNVWLTMRMSADESPNYFVTKDFIHFAQISHVNPEKPFNWMKTELYNLDTIDGRSIQGILYKPENFDATRKYPVVFFYYEKKSDNLNSYIYPALSDGPLNIPWMVAHGYLVFTPDIFYRIGYPGESALRCVLAVRKALIQLPFIDSTSMGIYGHSMGGYETNYIITHSTKFQAACTASGIVDLVSGYGQIHKSGLSLQPIYETGQTRIGKSLWERPDLYFANSPIFYLDKVTTPVLIMHTADDGIVNVSQAEALFMGLTRMGKKAWFLLYKYEDHVLSQVGTIADYDTKLRQFFDYYLKNYEAPGWMKDM